MITRIKVIKSRMQEAAMRPFFHPAIFTVEKKQMCKRCQADQSQIKIFFFKVILFIKIDYSANFQVRSLTVYKDGFPPLIKE